MKQHCSCNNALNNTYSSTMFACRPNLTETVELLLKIVKHSKLTNVQNVQAHHKTRKTPRRTKCPDRAGTPQNTEAFTGYYTPNPKLVWGLGWRRGEGRGGEGGRVTTPPQTPPLLTPPSSPSKLVSAAAWLPPCFLPSAGPKIKNIFGALLASEERQDLRDHLLDNLPRGIQAGDCHVWLDLFRVTRHLPSVCLHTPVFSALVSFCSSSVPCFCALLCVSFYSSLL